jgi:hypothetical protein
LSFNEVENFCGNALMLKNNKLVMSKRAYDNLSPANLATLEENYTIIAPSIPTIEYIGGGSARCMIAELF